MTTKQAAAKRTNVKTSTRYNDAMEFEGWNINFDYEKNDGVLSKTISARAVKEGAQLYASKTDGNFSINFTNTSFDAALVEAVQNEFNEISK